MEGQAPFHGNDIHDYGGLAIGTDLVSVDSAVTKMMGFEINEIPHLMHARRELWPDGIPTIELFGSGVDALKRRFKRPVLSSIGQFPKIECIECGVCNGCLSAIRHSLDKLRFECDMTRLPTTTLVSGRPMCNQQTLLHWTGQLILFGNCAIEFQFYNVKQRQKGIIIKKFR